MPPARIRRKENEGLSRSLNVEIKWSVEIGKRWCIILEFSTDVRGGNHLYL
jgi:hypothetical protein